MTVGVKWAPERPGSCFPRVYVYGSVQDLDYSARGSAQGSAQDLDGERPQSLRLREHRINVTEHASLEALAHRRALGYRCRTAYRSNAHLFFVPLAHVCIADAQQLQLLASMLRRRGGFDHFLVVDRLDDADNRSALVAGTAWTVDLLARQLEGSSSPSKCSRVPLGSAMRLVAGTGALPDENFRRVPPTSVLRVGPRARAVVPWAERYARRLHIAARAPENWCTRWPLRPNPEFPKAEPCRWVASNASREEAADVFHRATYCMLAPGAQAAADAVDAILLGCVPVLHPRAPVLENEWPWHWQPNDEAALTLSADAWDAENNPEGPVNLVAFTETKRLRGLRGQIALTSHRLLYAAVDTRHIARVLPNFRAPADAFDVIVARVWARAQQADPELTALAKKAARL